MKPSGEVTHILKIVQEIFEKFNVRERAGVRVRTFRN